MIHWGVLGTGGIAARFARSIAHAEDAEITAVSGRTPAHVAAFAEQFHVGQTFASHEALLESGVDAVYIALPHHMHARWAMAALGRKTAVLSEKPACLSEAEMAEVARCASANGTLYMEAMKTRFEPAYIRAKRDVEAGRIGTLQEMRLSDCCRMMPSESFHFRRGIGGCLLDGGCYCLNWVQDYFGADLTAELLDSHVENGVDLYLKVLLHDSCHRVVLECAFDRQKPQTAELTGSGGQMTVTPVHRPDTVVCGTEEYRLLPDPDDMYAEIRHFCDLLREGRTESPVMSLRDSLEIAHLSDKIRALLPETAG